MCIKLTMVSMKLQIVVSEGEATTAEAIMQRPVQVLASIALPFREYSNSRFRALRRRSVNRDVTGRPGRYRDQG